MKQYYPFNAIIWGIFGVILWTQFITDASNIEAILFSFLFIIITYPFTTFLSKSLIHILIVEEKFILFSFYFIVITIISSCLVVVSYKVVFYLESIEIFTGSSFFNVGFRDQKLFSGVLLITLLINFGFCGLKFYKENIKLQKVMIESHLKVLQDQISPHFMFNVLNHIHILIKKDPELASELLLQYTDVLRYQLYSGSQERIPLVEEVIFLKNFINVEKVRWKNKLTVNSIWDIENNDFKIPPQLLIIFVENAFKHVFRSTEEQGVIDIQLIQKKQTLDLTIKNSKSKEKKAIDKNAGVGIKNIKKRLDILLPNQYELRINETNTTYLVKLNLFIK